MKKHIVRSVCLLLSTALFLAGCNQEAPPEHTELNELLPEEEIVETEETSLLPEQFSLAYIPGRPLDPIICPDGMQQVIASLVCERLFRQNTAFEPEPWLCESIACDEEYLVYTLTLRSGITFSDGSPLSAADVKDTLERARVSPRYQSRLADVTTVSAAENTVTIRLSSPNSSFPALLDIPIVKAGSPEDLPVGTGPYFLSQEEANTCLIANRTWWRGFGQPVSRIMLTEAADQETMLYRFVSRDVQLVAADLVGTSATSITGDIRYQDTDTTVLQYLGCNTVREPLNSTVLRRIIARGVNRTDIVNVFLSGHGTAAQFPLSPRSSLYPAALEETYSRDAFIAALEKSGYVSERPLILLVNAENGFKVAAAQHLAEVYSAAGLPMEVSVLPWEEYTAALLAGEFDLYYGEVRLTADWDLSALVGTGGSLNYSGWTSPLTDQLLADYSAASDRAAAMQALCVHLQTQAPIIPLCFKATSVLLQADTVENLSPTATETFYNLSDCVIHLRGSK